MPLTEALEPHRFGQLGVLGSHQLDLLKLRETALLVKVSDHRFQLGESSWSSPPAMRLSRVSLWSSMPDHIATAFRWDSLLACCWPFFGAIWTLRAQLCLSELAVDNV